MGDLHKTALNDRHVKLGANMVEFAGWEMPLHYETGIVQEHLITRQDAGLFDISHMGRFTVRLAGGSDPAAVFVDDFRIGDPDQNQWKTLKGIQPAKDKSIDVKF